MGRLDAWIALTLLALAAPAGAAELTRVPSASPFELDLSVSWVRTQRSGSIARESAAAAVAGQPFPVVGDLRQLRFAETTNTLVARAAVGLWEDLGLTVEVPYLLGKESGWRLGSGVGAVAELPDTIGTNALRPDGTACAGACAIFPTANTVYHGASLGDVRVGLDWGIFSDKRDDTKPFWLVGVEVTFPTAKLYDPGANRTANWVLPTSYYTTSSTAPAGEKLLRYDLHTTLSRRIGRLDPYFKAHVTLLQKSSGTPSNCDHAADLVAPDPTQALPDMVTLCQGNADRWGARLPWLAGLTFGVELVPYEDRAAGQKLAFDFRLSGDYTSSARWLNELSDATGKLMATEAHATGTARIGFVFRASENVSVQGAASYGYTTPHFLSGEDPGLSGGAVTNPNYDWRYDAPGRRFRISESTTFEIVAAGVILF
jgi:hypothetical protein